MLARELLAEAKNCKDPKQQMRVLQAVIDYQGRLGEHRSELKQLIETIMPELRARLQSDRVRQEVIEVYGEELKALSRERERVLKEKRQRMKETALGLLMGEVGLGLAVRLVGHLEMTNTITANEFLEARLKWLAGREADLFEWLDGLLMILTQYRALYSDARTLSWHLVRLYGQLEDRVQTMITNTPDLRGLWNRLVMANGPFSSLQCDFMGILEPLFISHALTSIMAPSEKAFAQIIGRLKGDPTIRQKTLTSNQQTGDYPALLILSRAWAESQKALQTFSHPLLKPEMQSWLQRQRTELAAILAKETAFLQAFDRAFK